MQGLEDARGQMAFNILNKVVQVSIGEFMLVVCILLTVDSKWKVIKSVQLMMSFEVPKGSTEDLAKQLIDTGQFNHEYTILVRDMIQYVELNPP